MVIPSSALGFAGFTAPSNRITFGMIGFGLMMRGHFNTMLNRGNAQILAVCDVDTKKREKARDQVNAKYGDKGCDCYNEHEKITERGDIDAYPPFIWK